MKKLQPNIPIQVKNAMPLPKVLCLFTRNINVQVLFYQLEDVLSLVN